MLLPVLFHASVAVVEAGTRMFGAWAPFASSSTPASLCLTTSSRRRRLWQAGKFSAESRFSVRGMWAGIDQLLGPIPEEMLCRGGGQPHDEIPVGGSAARSHVVSLRAGSERRVVRHTHRRVLRAHDAPDLQAPSPSSGSAWYRKGMRE